MNERKCYRCGKDQAEGFASVWTAKDGERWYCHGDDDESPTCYEGSERVGWREPLAEVTSLIRDLQAPAHRHDRETTAEEADRA